MNSLLRPFYDNNFALRCSSALEWSEHIQKLPDAKVDSHVGRKIDQADNTTAAKLALITCPTVDEEINQYSLPLHETSFSFYLTMTAFAMNPIKFQDLD